MQQPKDNILACLQDLKGSGKFASIHTTDFLFPGLEVEDVGEIAYPVNGLQARALIWSILAWKYIFCVSACMFL